MKITISIQICIYSLLRCLFCAIGWGKHFFGATTKNDFISYHPIPETPFQPPETLLNPPETPNDLLTVSNFLDSLKLLGTNIPWNPYDTPWKLSEKFL